jgi:hypothetical protein
MLRQPIKATLILSLGAKGADQTCEDMTVVAEKARAEFLRKLLLDGFIIRFFVGYWFAIYKIQVQKDSLIDFNILQTPKI